MEQELFAFLQARLSPQAPAPLYLQLKQAIEAAITGKLLNHGSVLPAERRLSETLGVSRVTVVKALGMLTEQGLVVKHHGKGSQVSLPVNYNLSGGGFSTQASRSGVVSNRWLRRELTAAGDELASELELSPGDTMAVIKRVRLVDKTPVSLETMFIPEIFLPYPDQLDGSLYAYWLTLGLEPDVQEYALSICTPTAEEAELLAIPPTASLMKIVLKSRDKLGRVLEYGTAICRSDFYQFHFTVKS